MTKSKSKIITVENIDITVASINGDDFISLTDMAKSGNAGNRAADVIKNWIRNRSTIEFLGAWETIHNPDFKVVEFDHFRKSAGLPSFVMSPKQWVLKTNSVGIISKSGRYGGTYAHKDIAFEFGSAISPLFKIYLIKEYQRLKEIESNAHNLEWDVKRILSKANYKIHTDAIKEHILPKSKLAKDKKWLEYANEADLLNMAMFGCTAKEWREANPKHAIEGKTIRDVASINELTVLSNIESLNAELIASGASKKDRFHSLSKTVKRQLKSLIDTDFFKSLKRDSDSTYLDAEKQSEFNKNLIKGIGFNHEDSKGENKK